METHLLCVFRSHIFYGQMTVNDGRLCSDSSDNEPETYDNRNLSQSLLFQQCKSVPSCDYHCDRLQTHCVCAVYMTSAVFGREKGNTSEIFNGTIESAN